MSRVDWNDANFMRRFLDAVDVGVTESANVAADYAARSLGRDHGRVPSMPGFPPNSQDGTLRNSIVYVGAKKLGTPGKAAIGSELAYARILELGGIIRAKNVRALPVPVNRAAKEMLRKAKGRSLRMYKLVMIKQPGKPPMLVERTPTGREKKNGAVFVLKPSITIKPRPYLMAAVRNSAKEMEARFVQAARNHLKSTG